METGLDGVSLTSVCAIEDFTYTQERLTDDQIRIINIHPGRREEAMCCTLETIQRNSNEPYETLSYVWGESPREYTIFVNRKRFLVKSNLRDALYRIRQRDQVVRIWIDAICINQEDNEERNSQVQRMGQTYTRAKEVIIWLGDREEPSQSLRGLCSLADIIENCSQNDVREKLEAIRDVFTCTWFSRLWTLQEAVLPRKRTVRLGNEYCDLGVLLVLSIHFLEILFCLAGESEINLGDPVLDNLVNCRDIMYLSGGPDGTETVQEFSDLVLKSLTRQCQDPRDLIFGLVGIAEQSGINSEEVDYTKSTREVYQTFMKHALQEDVDVLILFHTGDIRPLGVDLPSWVPDFTHTPQASAFHYDLYNVGGMDAKLQLPESALSASDGLLILSGHQFDVVCSSYFIPLPMKLKPADTGTY